MEEVKYLYNRMKNGCTIKKKDKDEYLPSKFLSKDVKRCNELFNEYTITRISKLFVKTNLSETMEIRACEIINNYLKRSYACGLNESQLRNYKHLIDNPDNSEDLKIEAKMCIRDSS